MPGEARSQPARRDVGAGGTFRTDRADEQRQRDAPLGEDVGERLGTGNVSVGGQRDDQSCSHATISAAAPERQPSST